MRNIRLFYNQRARTLSDDNGKFLSLCFFFDCFFHSGKVKRIYFHNMFYAAGPGHIRDINGRGRVSLWGLFRLRWAFFPVDGLS